jgi:hypothetical protein
METFIDTDTLLEKPTTEGYVSIPVHRIVKAPWNYKEEDDARAEQLRAKIEREGAIVNLVVRLLPNQTADDGGPLFEAVDGNHRIEAYLKAGREEAVCYNKGEITEAHAKRIAVEINEGDFDADPLDLAETLNDIEEEFGREDWMQTSPFTEQEMDNFDDMLDFDWDSVEAPEDDEEGAEGEGDDPDHWETVEFLLTENQMNVWEEAKERVLQQLEEEGYDLPDDPPLRRGQILELLAADHLTGAPIDTEEVNEPVEEEPPF